MRSPDDAPEGLRDDFVIPLSIVIPSCNRRESLQSLLIALFAQHDPARALEIVVVLDGSTDGSEDVVAQRPPMGIRLRVVHQENRGRAAARNAGIHMATGEILLFLDDDVCPNDGLINAHLRSQQTADVVLGRIDHNAGTVTPNAIASQDKRLFEERHRLLSSDPVVIRATDVFAGNLSVKRSWLDIVGGYDHAVTGYGCEDWDLGHRLLAAGARVAYEAGAIVVRNSTMTGRRQVLNAWQEGRSQFLFASKHPSLASHLDIASSQPATWVGFLAAQCALQHPRIGLAISVVGIRLVSRSESVLRLTLARRIALYCWRIAFWSGVSSAAGSGAHARANCRLHVRILCYHRVTDTPNPELARWAVRPREFAAQIDLLKRQGYRGVTMRALLDAFDAGKPLDKLIAVTFDDGYLDTVKVAVPILAAAGFPATLFVVPGLVGGTAEWDRGFGGAMAPLATWEQVRTLEQRGWEIGLHSMDHIDLTTLSDEAIRSELRRGQAELTTAIGEAVTSFAYPYGAYNSRTSRLVAEAGFSGAVALGRRTATAGSPRFELERAMVHRGVTRLGFRAILATGSDLWSPFRVGATLPRRMLRRVRKDRRSE